MKELDLKNSEKIKKYNIDTWSEIEDYVVVETPLNIQINNSSFITLMCTPDKMEELALGFLFCERVIKDYSEVKSIKINNATINIELDKKVMNYKFSDRVLSSGCGKGSIHISMINEKLLNRIQCNKTFEVEKIMCLMNNFNKNSELFIETGGVHSCALADENNVVIFAEDIGRHNAFDKIIGFSLKNSIDMSDKMLLTSGRMSSDIIIKAASANVPVVVSHSAPTHLAIKIARSLNITLVGFVRGKRLNVYTSYDRIR